MTDPKYSRREMLVTIAHMYYIQGLSQMEIAHRLELSRSSVSRLLKQCVEQNVIEFRINDFSAKTLNLQQRIQSEFGLQNAVVTPSGATLKQSKAEVALAALNHLKTRLRESSHVGVGWGSTVYALVNAFKALDSVKLSDVTQLVGCIGMYDTDTDGDIIVRELAHATHARAHILPTPFFVQSVMLKKMLMSEPHIARHFARFQSLDAVLAAFGSTVGASSLSAIFTSGLISDYESRALVDAGSAGDLCGLLFTKSGRQVENAITERVIGISRGQLSKAPRVYGMAVGAGKTDATIACLRSGLVHTVFLDEALAQSVLRSI